MANSSFDDLIIPALGALAAAAPRGMTLPELEGHLETRLGSTDESAGDARSPESRAFVQAVRDLLSSEQGSESLIDRGFVEPDGTGGVFQITPSGRAFIGR